MNHSRPPKVDYKLSTADSARITCTACSSPAIYGQNEGKAPFWYHCELHASRMREFGNVWTGSK